MIQKERKDGAYCSRNPLILVLSITVDHETTRQYDPVPPDGAARRVCIWMNIWTEAMYHLPQQLRQLYTYHYEITRYHALFWTRPRFWYVHLLLLEMSDR